MLTVQLPVLLALLGTALMAVVIFAPAPAAAKVTASLAPPLMKPPFDRWERAPDSLGTLPRDDDAAWCAMTDDARLAPAVAEPVPETGLAVPYPAWPALVDARAAFCDATARLELVVALAAVRTPWSEDVLRCGLAEEADPCVRDAIVAALAA